MNTLNYLLWLLQCERLIKKTGICIDSIAQVDDLMDQIIKKIENELSFEKENFSLIGYSGTGLAIMTRLESCDNTWLDLLG